MKYSKRHTPLKSCINLAVCISVLSMMSGCAFNENNSKATTATKTIEPTPAVKNDNANSETMPTLTKEEQKQKDITTLQTKFGIKVDGNIGGETRCVVGKGKYEQIEGLEAPEYNIITDEQVITFAKEISTNEKNIQKYEVIGKECKFEIQSAQVNLTQFIKHPINDGLKYRLLESTNKTQVYTTDKNINPKLSDVVEINYIARTIKGNDVGEIFDNSYAVKPSILPLEVAFNGLGYGLRMMEKGNTYQLIIPPELAFGDKEIANVPQGSTLLFTIKLIDFYPKDE